MKPNECCYLYNTTESFHMLLARVARVFHLNVSRNRELQSKPGPKRKPYGKRRSRGSCRGICVPFRWLKSRIDLQKKPCLPSDATTAAPSCLERKEPRIKQVEARPWAHGHRSLLQLLPFACPRPRKRHVSSPLMCDLHGVGGVLSYFKLVLRPKRKRRTRRSSASKCATWWMRHLREYLREALPCTRPSCALPSGQL